MKHPMGVVGDSRMKAHIYNCRRRTYNKRRLKLVWRPVIMSAWLDWQANFSAIEAMDKYHIEKVRGQ